MTTTFPSFKHDEPVEIRIGMANHIFQLVAWLDERGCVSSSLNTVGGSIPHSLSNLQSRVAFPGKAVTNWQHEVIRFAEAGLGKILEIR